MKVVTAISISNSMDDEPDWADLIRDGPAVVTAAEADTTRINHMPMEIRMNRYKNTDDITGKK